jgi:hypothetical protein
MAIVRSTPYSEVLVGVDRSRPFRTENTNTNTNTYILTSVGNRTLVAWRLQGTNLYAMKVIEVPFGVGGLFGKHLGQGLENLKAVAEGSTLSDHAG